MSAAQLLELVRKLVAVDCPIVVDDSGNPRCAYCNADQEKGLPPHFDHCEWAAAKELARATEGDVERQDEP